MNIIALNYLTQTDDFDQNVGIYQNDIINHFNGVLIRLMGHIHCCWIQKYFSFIIQSSPF